MAEMRYREALNLALREEMTADERVFLMGEDIGVFQGAFKVTAGLMEEFGEKRVRDTPISENTIVGMGVGAAMAGLRPVVELMTINFSLLALDQIINSAASIRYMFGAQVKVPLVIRMPQGAGHQLGPTHSHCFEAHVHARARPAGGGAHHRRPTRAGCSRPPSATTTPWSSSSTRRSTGARAKCRRTATSRCASARPPCGARATASRIVGISRQAETAMKGAEVLAAEHGIEAEVIDPRTLRPLDLDTILESVRKTNRAVIVEEGWPHGGVGANMAALIQEQAFDYLDAPVGRVTGADVPMPYSKPLEQASFPHEEHVVQAALATFRDV